MTTTPAPAANARPLSLWLRFAGLAAVPPLVWVLARFDVLPHVALCLFERATGKACPGCGMTRSILRLSQGDVVGSLRFHPLGIVLAGMFAVALWSTTVALVRGDDPALRYLERRGPWFVTWLVGAFVVVWVVRAFVVPEWAPEPVR